MRFFALSMLLLITLGSAQDDTQSSPAPADYQSGFARGLELGMEVASLQGAASFSPEASGLFNQTALKFNQVLDQVFGQGSNLSNLYRLQLYGLKSNNATNITEGQTAENMTAENATAINATVMNETVKNTNTENITTKNTAIDDTIAENITAVKTNEEDIATKMTTEENIIAENTENITAENTTKENITAENHTAKDLLIEHSPKNETAYAMNATNDSKEIAIPELIDNITIDIGDDTTVDFSDVIKDKDWDGNLETAPEFMRNMPGPETV